MNYAPYLGAIRDEHVRATARSIGAALIKQPGLEALLSVAASRQFPSRALHASARTHLAGRVVAGGLLVVGRLGARAPAVAGGRTRAARHLAQISRKGEI